jgi:hypothetical protein
MPLTGGHGIKLVAGRCGQGGGVWSRGRCVAVTMPTARSRAVSELDFVPGTYPPLMRVEEGCLGKESNNLTCVNV